MTEAEWLAATDPQPMLEEMNDKASVRKSRLVRVAAARSRWVELTEDFRGVIEVGERYAEGGATEEELTEAARSIYDLFTTHNGLTRADRPAPELAALAISCVNGNPLVKLARGASWSQAARLVSRNLPAILRDIFGNPFHPVAVDPAWLTSTVVGLAQAVYAESAFDRLPVLADALQEAGCDRPDILDHCRGDGTHVRGCWVVDVLLGKQ